MKVRASYNEGELELVSHRIVGDNIYVDLKGPKGVITVNSKICNLVENNEDLYNFLLKKKSAGEIEEKKHFEEDFLSVNKEEEKMNFRNQLNSIEEKLKAEGHAVLIDNQNNVRYQLTYIGQVATDYIGITHLVPEDVVEKTEAEIRKLISKHLGLNEEVEPEKVEEVKPKKQTKKVEEKEPEKVEEKEPEKVEEKEPEKVEEKE